MANNLGFLVRVYGTVDQQPPYKATNGNLSGIQATYPTDQILISSFPSTPINVWNVAGGVKMGGSVICYGVIEVPASGLQVHSTKYVTQETATAINTLRNA